MPTIRGCWVGLLLLLVCGLHPVHAQDDDPDSFSSLAARTDPDDAAAAKRARETLESRDPNFWYEVHEPGPFRSALARSLTADEVRRRLDAVRSDPSTLATVVRNLGSRRDLGALLVEGDRFDALVPGHIGVLRNLAVDDLWDGRRELGTCLLGTVDVAEDAADDFAYSPAAAAAQLVADVVTGAVPVPAEALAEIARADPTSTQPRRDKALGAERIAALLEVARTHDDHRLRVLAARLLELATDQNGAALAAWAAIRSTEAGHYTWFHLARFAWQPLPIDQVPEFAMLAALRGEMAYGFVFAGDDFDDADAAAQRLATAYERLRDPRVRAGLLSNLERIDDKFVVRGVRKHAVPAWRAFLAGLLTPRDGDPPLVRELARRSASRLLADLEREPARDRRAHVYRPAPVVDPGPAAMAWADALVGARSDPARLLDLIEICRMKRRGPSEYPETRVPLADAMRQGLRELVLTCPDSRGARLAAGVLTGLGDIEDVVFVLRQADRLALDEAERVYRVPDLDSERLTDDDRFRILELVTDSSLSPAARCAVMTSVSADLPTWGDEDAPPSTTTVARLTAWFEEVAPGLDGGLAEEALEWAIEDVWNRGEYEVEGNAEYAKRVRAAIERVPAEGPRLRLLRLLSRAE